MWIPKLKLNSFYKSVISYWANVKNKNQNFIFDCRREYWRNLLKSLGANTDIYGKMEIWNPGSVSIGSNCTLNHGIYMVARPESPIVIEDDVRISANATLITVGLDFDGKEPPFQHQVAGIKIEKGCWIGAGATILPGVTVGERSVIASGAVVSKDVAPWTVVGGIPAKEIKTISKP